MATFRSNENVFGFTDNFENLETSYFLQLIVKCPGKSCHIWEKDITKFSRVGWKEALPRISDAKVLGEAFHKNPEYYAQQVQQERSDPNVVELTGVHIITSLEIQIPIDMLFEQCLFDQ
jgi:hypothetical protein